MPKKKRRWARIIPDTGGKIVVSKTRRAPKGFKWVKSFKGKHYFIKK